VNDPCAVRGLEGRRDLLRNGDEVGIRQPPLRHVDLEVPPLHAFHRNERGAFMLREVMDRADVRVIQPRKRLRFAPEAPDSVRIVRQLFWKEFQGDRPAQTHVERLVHHPHAPHAELPRDVVVRHVGADHRARG
jgi:hypothetical protein